MSMTPKPIFTAGPSVTSKEIAYVTDAITNGLNEHTYDYIKKLQAALSSYVSVKHVQATSCCTGAIHLALWAMGVGPGDEVIGPDMTWIASMAPVHYLGATPVFVDVKRDTWCIDPAAVERAITPKTKAIVAVHSYGYPADMDSIMAIAAKHNLKVVEDAAPSLGSSINGKRTGSLGHVGAFSFHGSKLAASGEGGAVCTNDDALFHEISVIGNHGRDGGRPLTAARWGIKYNMSNLQAAFALAQVERMDELVEKKRQNYAWYKAALSGLSGFTMSIEEPGVFWNAWQTSIVLEEGMPLSRDALMDALKELGIDTRPFFPPISSLPMVAQDLSKQNPHAYYVGSHGINLPSRHDLTPEDVDRIASALKTLLKLS